MRHFDAPGLGPVGAGEAPRSYPNSSLSSKVPGMAGQFTFTKGPVFQGDSAWTMRAMMSFPVPLSPWIRTGTLAPATLDKRSRRACMASELPKTIASDGISPIACTRELTEFVTVAAMRNLQAPLRLVQVHPRHQTPVPVVNRRFTRLKLHSAKGL
jgi:hypothetical protein